MEFYAALAQACHLTGAAGFCTLESAGTAMGSWGIGYARPLCEEGCGRRAYTMDEVLGPICCVCFAAAQRAWAARFWGGPPGRQRFPLQLHLIGECGDLTLSFVFGDGWSGQCSCTRCGRRWLNNGWTCPVDHNRSRYLRMLDEFYAAYSYSPDELPYVDWDAACIVLHDMLTGFAEWELDVLLEFAEVSARIVDQSRRRALPHPPAAAAKAAAIAHFAATAETMQAPRGIPEDRPADDTAAPLGSTAAWLRPRGGM